MSAYTAPIVKNGLVFPMLFLSILIGVVLYGLSSVLSESEIRNQRYATFQDRIKTAGQLEVKLKPGRERQTKYEAILKAEIKPLVSRQISQSMARYVDKEYELQQISLKQTEDRGSIGAILQSNFSRVLMSFRGGFGPMQETLLDLESEFPQLQMERMSITRAKGTGLNQREALTFNVDYIAWKW